MDFIVSGLDPQSFAHLLHRSDDELAARGVLRVVADAPTGFPCRVMLADAEVGDTLLLLHYEHQPAETPYRASHAIYVNEKATQPVRYENDVPEALRTRKFLSLRGFDAAGMLVDADIAEGANLKASIVQLLQNPKIAYVHVHYAATGCYAALVERR